MRVIGAFHFSYGKKQENPGSSWSNREIPFELASCVNRFTPPPGRIPTFPPGFDPLPANLSTHLNQDDSNRWGYDSIGLGDDGFILQKQVINIIPERHGRASQPDPQRLDSRAVGATTRSAWTA
jgi:hypothetical protein